MSGAVSEEEEFAPIVVGVHGVTQAVLRTASMVQGILVVSSGNVADEVWRNYIKTSSRQPDDGVTIP